MGATIFAKQKPNEIHAEEYAPVGQLEWQMKADEKLNVEINIYLHVDVKHH